MDFFYNTSSFFKISGRSLTEEMLLLFRGEIFLIELLVGPSNAVLLCAFPSLILGNVEGDFWRFLILRLPLNSSPSSLRTGGSTLDCAIFICFFLGVSCLLGGVSLSSIYNLNSLLLYTGWLILSPFLVIRFSCNAAYFKGECMIVTRCLTFVSTGLVGILRLVPPCGCNPLSRKCWFIYLFSSWWFFSSFCYL